MKYHIFIWTAVTHLSSRVGAKHTNRGGRGTWFKIANFVAKNHIFGNFHNFFFLTAKVKINEGGCLKQRKKK